jgi:tetratricopeptide (TPR) repeat protein
MVFSVATYARDGRWGEVKDPHFGEVLYHFYQQKYFSAITHLMAAQAGQHVKHHKDEAELLRGGMYLSYGLHREAGKIFQRLIDQGAPPDVRDRAWFYLAKIWYQRGYVEQAVEALSRIQQALPGDLQEERQVLAALLLMKREKYKEVVKVLGRFSGRSEWASYARYNMGVALVKLGQKDDGVKLLEDIGEMRAGDNEMRALRDKANLALGYTFLRLGGPERAESYLENVRLKGPFSNKALLGMGWALSARGQDKRSLVPWMELQSRHPIDVAVQESLLAVPYALRQLKADKQSLQNYEAAISVYSAEIARLGHAIESIRAGKLLIADLLQGPATETGWFWRLKRLSDTPESRYLTHLLARHDFHEALKNYRDLVFLSANLSQWLINIDAFDAMLETRRKGYEERLPRIIQKYNALDLTSLVERRDDYAERLASIVGQHNAMALANSEERRLLATLDRVNARIDRISDDTDIADYRVQHKLFSGLLLWQISTDYKPRLRRAKKAIQELDDALVQAESRQQSLQAAQKYARKGFEGYQSRITTLRQRLRKLESQVKVVIRDHQHYLQELAVAALETQKKRLRAYITQARFGIAQIYDRSVSRVEKQ